MNFGICQRSPDSPTEAVAVITDLDYHDWLWDATNFLTFDICTMSHYSNTEAVAIIINLKFLD